LLQNRCFDDSKNRFYVLANTIIIILWVGLIKAGFLYFILWVVNCIWEYKRHFVKVIVGTIHELSLQ